MKKLLIILLISILITTMIYYLIGDNFISGSKGNVIRFYSFIEIWCFITLFTIYYGIIKKKPLSNTFIDNIYRGKKRED